MARDIKHRSLPGMYFYFFHNASIVVLDGDAGSFFVFFHGRIPRADSDIGYERRKITTNVHTNILDLPSSKAKKKNSAQESWIRRNSFWKNIFSKWLYDSFLHNPPAQLLCIVTCVTLEVVRAERQTNPLALCYLLTLYRQEKH